MTSAASARPGRPSTRTSASAIQQAISKSFDLPPITSMPSFFTSRQAVAMAAGLASGSPLSIARSPARASFRWVRMRWYSDVGE